MTEAPFEDRPNQGAFPEAVDDDYPERDRVPEVREPSLPGVDGYIGAGSVGTTAEEVAEGENLDEKLSHEVPDVVVDPLVPRDPDEALDWDEQTDGSAVGQLTAPDQGVGPDEEPDAIALEDEVSADASPEESALHVEREG